MPGKSGTIATRALNPGWFVNLKADQPLKKSGGCGGEKASPAYSLPGGVLEQAAKTRARAARHTPIHPIGYRNDFGNVTIKFITREHGPSVTPLQGSKQADC
jgi:hypothetical protein